MIDVNSAVKIEGFLEVITGSNSFLIFFLVRNSKSMINDPILVRSQHVTEKWSHVIGYT